MQLVAFARATSIPHATVCAHNVNIYIYMVLYNSFLVVQLLIYMHACATARKLLHIYATLAS